MLFLGEIVSASETFWLQPQCATVPARTSVEQKRSRYKVVSVKSRLPLHYTHVCCGKIRHREHVTKDRIRQIRDDRFVAAIVLSRKLCYSNSPILESTEI